MDFSQYRSSNTLHRNATIPPSSSVPAQMTMSSQTGGIPSVMHQPHQPHPYSPYPTHQPSPLSPNNGRKRRLSDDETVPIGLPYPPVHQTMYQESNALISHAPEPELATAAPPPPPPKKSRVNTPWTPAEEQRLKVMREAGNSWSEIAKSFPNRTEGSVKKHWYKDMHYAEFAEDESTALLGAIREYEASKWKVIGQKLGKPAKACEQYAKEHFTKEQLAGKT